MAEITVASRRPSSHRVRPAALLSASGGSTLAERLRTHANDPLEVAAQVRLVAEAARPGRPIQWLPAQYQPPGQVDPARDQIPVRRHAELAGE